MVDSRIMVNGFDMARFNELEPALQSIVQRRATVLGPAYKLFYDHPVEFVRGSGVHLYDAEGREYLDAYNNVPSVGHCHPHVVEAIATQAAKLNTHTRYANALLVGYAERLVATFPSELSNVMFTCTGSEAVDLALRVARFSTGGDGVLVTSNAYHGTTQAAAEISPNLGPFGPQNPHVWSLDVPIADERNLAVAGKQFGDSARAAISEMTRQGIRFAGFIADTLLSTDGIFPNPAGFWQPVVDAVHDAAGLFIADEVQPGFARTGRAMWNFQNHGVVPDLVVIGKPMGNGMPIAAMVARPEILKEFGAKVRYFNTFGANSVSISAANAVLDVIESEHLMGNSLKVGEELRASLTALSKSRQDIGAVRGTGLYVGVDIVSPDSGIPDATRAMVVVNGLRERRVLVSATGPAGNVLKIRPPLIFSSQNVQQFIEALADVLTTLG